MNKSEAVACLYMQMTHISNDQFEKTWARICRSRFYE